MTFLKCRWRKHSELYAQGSKMQLLLIGNGGREHALAWKLAQSSLAERILIAPGNGGTTLPPKCENRAVSAENLDGLVELAQTEKIDLVMVGPEVPLVAG